MKENKFSTTKRVQLITRVYGCFV